MAYNILVVDDSDTVRAFVAKSLGRAGADLTTFLGHNRNTIISLADTSRSTLELLAKYAPEYACLLTAVADYKPRVDKAFGDGGLKVRMNVVADRGKYLPGRDEPVYGDKPGPRCYGPKAATFRPINTGLPNSPAEEQMLAAVLAPAMNVPPEQVPEWSSLLVGPLLRGAEVTAG